MFTENSIIIQLTKRHYQASFDGHLLELNVKKGHFTIFGINGKSKSEADADEKAAIKAFKAELIAAELFKI